MSQSVHEPERVLLRYRPFALFWSARLCSNFAYNMQAVAVGWQLYDLTGDPLDLGLVGLVQFLPVLLLTLLVGQVADRYDRRLIVTTCQTVEAGAAVFLALASFGGWIGREGILATMALAAVARAFEEPSLTSIMPALVPSALMSRASAWSTSANQLGKITGPALGGVLYLLGPGAVHATVGLLFGTAGVLVLLIRVQQAARAREPISLATMFSGIAFIRRKRVILGSLSLDMFVVLLGGATALLPVYARDVLLTGPWGLGLLRAAPGLGALAVALVLARRSIEPHVGPLLFGVVLTFGCATIVFGLSRSLLLSLVALAVLGGADVVSVVIRVALVQLQTPDAMRGRVTAVQSLFQSASNRLGEFESGLTAAIFGAVPAVLIGGVGTVLVALVWMRLFPELPRIRTLDSAEEARSAPA